MRTTPLHNEKELLRLVGEGNENAFNTITTHYWQKIYSVALTFVKSTHTAEDIVQDVFLKVWEKRAGLAKVDNFSAWLFITARNSIISFLRKKEPAFLAEGSLPAELADRQPVSEESLQLKQLQELVQKGLDLLPEQQRRIYIMSREQGLSHEEICDQLGLARSTVKNSLVKSLNFLRQYLREQNDPYIILMAAFLMYI